MVEVFGAEWCTYCNKLKKALEVNNIPFNFIDIDTQVERSVELIEQNLKTIPQAFLEGTLIRGCDDTLKYFDIDQEG